MPLQNNFRTYDDPDTYRRRLLSGTSWFFLSQVTCANDSTAKFRWQEFGYSVQLPPTLSVSVNPLTSHSKLTEIIFSGDGLQVGITVDPIRISSLQQFGTPEEVVAHVETAKVNRDGAFEVTLLNDPVEMVKGAYLLTYLSKGKHGDKHFLCKIYIENQKLYALTAQVKEFDYIGKEKEIMEVVHSFRILK